jgi:hypothetical protein
VVLREVLLRQHLLSLLQRLLQLSATARDQVPLAREEQNGKKRHL